ncbi:MAG: MerR family DNA-binding transcriptional regulator, partial [Roseovarius gahaiensis]
MSNSENWSMCQIACWAVAALIGLLILLGTTGAVGFMAALMAGAAMAVFGGLVLTTRVNDDDTNIDKDKPLYVISVAAELVDMHPQTLRLYERKGLIEPSRSAGKTRLY